MRKICVALFAAVNIMTAAASEGGAPELRVRLDAKSPGRTFEGVGAVSAGATSVFLMDYPEPYRSDILDFLFKPGFGASFQHLKVELGSGMNSTCGAEPSHVIVPEELADPVPRGYELWLAAEARKRNPDIILDVLPWGTPYWTKGYTTPEAAKWVVSFLDVAREHYGLEFDYVGGYRNECRPAEAERARKFVVEHLRPALDKAGYRDVKIVGGDMCNLHFGPDYYWHVLKDMLKYPELAKSVDAVGYHYPVGYMTSNHDHRPLPKGFLESGIPLWSTEDFSNTGTFRHGWIYLRHILREYGELRMTKSEAWAPFSSLPDGFKWNKVGFLDAKDCRGGHYEVLPALWAVAHITQFAEPGWRFMDTAQGQICKNTGSYYTTLRNPKTGDWSLIAATDRPVTLDIQLDPPMARGPVSVWKSNEAEQFQKVAVLEAEDGKVHAELEGGNFTIYTLTTTTGQLKGQPSHPIPQKQASGSWKDDFQDYSEHARPRYWGDQEGTFEVVIDNGAKVLKQVVPEPGTVWGPSFGSCVSYFGGTSRVRTMKIDTEARVGKGFVEIGAGQNLEPTLRLQLDDSGKWTLLCKGKVLKEGNAADFAADGWNRLAFDLRGEPDSPGRITCAINGKKCFSGDLPPETIGAGLVPLIGSSYDPNAFKWIEVTPVP